MNQARNVLQFTIWYQITEKGKVMEDRYLFKAKRSDNGEWVIGNLITNVFFRLGQSIPYILCPDKAKYDCFEDFTEGNGIFEVRPDTICRCTGLNDKKGNLIWKNDIVKDTVIYGVVKWDYANARYVIDDREDGYQDYSEWWQETEVIGNIFDNPELLENEE
nr:MAG TPA: YopX protein [Caudoviricetes sp.]